MRLTQLCQACRALLRVPSITAISIVTVALGVGAGTSLFSVVKAVLLNPLPYPDAARLVWAAEVNDSGRPMNVSMDNYRDWSRENHSFSAMGAFEALPVNISTEPPRRIAAAFVTPGFFETMGVQPNLGRSFQPSEHVIGAPMTALIGHSLWQSAYGGDPKAIGRRIRLSGFAVTIVGIMPPGFDYPDKAEVWLSALAPGDYGERTAHNFRVVGRLRSGVALGEAQADLSGIARRLKRQYPGPYMARDALLTPLQVHIAGKIRPALLILFGAVGLLLLIVCVNVANLLLVRATARSREFAVRLALGAGRRHLVQQILLESILLAVAGGTLGFLVAFWSMDLLKVLLPPDLPRAADIRIDGAVFAFAAAVSAGAGLLFGLAPAWRATGMNIHEAVKTASRTMSAGRGIRLLQSALVISEVCLSLALLAGAGLLANSFARLRAVQPGFRSDHVLVAETFFSNPKDDADRRRPIGEYSDLLGRVRALAGVEVAGASSALPLDGAPDGSFLIEGEQPRELTDADYAVISPGYLGALGIPIVSGRDFSAGDTASAPASVIVSAAMAQRFWPGRSPLGQHIWFNSFEGDRRDRWLTIVGVAADVREDGLTRASMPLAYVCYTQTGRLDTAGIVIRTPLDAASLAGPVRAALHAVDPEATVSFTTMDRKLEEATAQQRFQLQVLGGFAALALLLAAVGLYGVLSYTVTGNRVEIGIRMALGAAPSSVFRTIVLRAMLLASTGAVLGVACFLLLRKALAALLFGVEPGDPATLAAATGVLILVALAAACLPAIRAMRVDPVAALREE